MRSFSPFFKQPSWLGPVIAAAILFWSVPATAAGFFLPTRGVEATARGGAAIAPHTADLDSLWHNPAGLSLLEGRQLTVDLAVVGVQSSHQRAPRQMDDGSTRTYDEVHNQAAPNTIPQILVGGTTGHPDINWGVGAYTHYTGGGQYPVDGPQRYVLVDNVGSAMGYLHAAISWKLSDKLAIGAGLQNFMGSFRIVAVGSAYVGMYGDPEDEDLDIFSETTMTSFFNPTANMGATYRWSESIQTGLSIQLPHIFRDRNATIETRWPSHPTYDNAEVSGEEADISIPFPFYVRGGVRFIGEQFDAEAALVYQHWSILDQVVASPSDVEVTGVPGVDSFPIEDLVIPQNFRNTLSAHLGGSYAISAVVDLRAGYVYERGAVPDSHYSVFSMDPDKHQLSIGGSYDFGDLSFDLTGAAILMPSKEITDSEVRQINPSDEGEHAIVVGNGTYDHFGYIVGLGVNYGF